MTAHHEPQHCICTDVAPTITCWCECHEARITVRVPRILQGPYEVRDSTTHRLIGVCAEQDRQHWVDSGYVVTQMG